MMLAMASAATRRRRRVAVAAGVPNIPHIGGAGPGGQDVRSILAQDLRDRPELDVAGLPVHDLRDSRTGIAYRCLPKHLRPAPRPARRGDGRGELGRRKPDRPCGQGPVRRRSRDLFGGAGAHEQQHRRRQTVAAKFVEGGHGTGRRRGPPVVGDGVSRSMTIDVTPLAKRRSMVRQIGPGCRAYSMAPSAGPAPRRIVVPDRLGAMEKQAFDDGVVEGDKSAGIRGVLISRQVVLLVLSVDLGDPGIDRASSVSTPSGRGVYGRASMPVDAVALGRRAQNQSSTRGLTAGAHPVIGTSPCVCMPGPDRRASRNVRNRSSTWSTARCPRRDDPRAARRR